MMTLRELEETVSSGTGTLNDSLELGESQRTQTAFHSTQSITGRRSLLTKDHVQYLSASDALKAYINDFEDSHPLQTSLYQRTVEDLLLPKSVLSQTVTRSLETGKRDSREEFHLHNVRRIIDESFEEIIRADDERRKAEAVPKPSRGDAATAGSELSSLPGPNVSQLTPVLKSTPLHHHHKLPSSSYQLRRTSKSSQAPRNEFRELGYTDLTPLKVKWSPDIERKYYVNERDARGRKVFKIDERKTESSKKMKDPEVPSHSEFSNSLSSGGKPPPSWVEDLDQSSLASSSVVHHSHDKIGPLRNGGFPARSESSYGAIDEITVLEEVDALVTRRAVERRLKRLRAEAMKERWLEDRRNESGMVEQPRQRNSKLKKTESVTTDDLVHASPFGLDRRKTDLGSSNLNKPNSSGFRVPQRYSGAILSKRTSGVFSKSDGSIEQRACLKTSGKPGEFYVASKTRSAPPISHFNPRTFRGLPGAESRVTGRKHLTRPVSPTRTESLIHASAYGYEEPFLVCRNYLPAEFPVMDHNAFQHQSDEITSGNISADEVTTLGSVGETSRVNAVLERAQRLMNAADEPPKTLNRHPHKSPESRHMIERYLNDSHTTSQQESDICRPLESLKQILFTLQDIEGSQTTEGSPGNELSNKEDLSTLETDDNSLETPRWVHQNFKEPPGTESMKRALVHLSRLKNLINEEEKPVSQR